MEISLFDDQNKAAQEALEKEAQKVVVKQVEEVVAEPIAPAKPVAPAQSTSDSFTLDEFDAFGAKLAVFGVGGGGGNAVKTMMQSGIKGVEFIAANTDIQALSKSPATKRLQIGKELTRGLGAGAQPAVGKKAAEESIQEIRDAIGDADMVFITAGMGGGTGTGAAPIIAQAAKDKKAVTVGVVTKPFQHEQPQRMRHAEEGIKELAKVVDSLIVIPNQRLLNSGSKSARVIDMFVKADEILCGAVRGIAELITGEGYINTDFADIRTVMCQQGMALMGIGKSTGENRAVEAAKMAIASPLLEDISIQGARGIVVNVTASEDILMEEYETAMSYITEIVHPSAVVVTGLVIDNKVGDDLSVTVIATGLDQTPSVLPTGIPAKNLPLNPDDQASQKASSHSNGLTTLHTPQSPVSNDTEIPTYIRKNQTVRAHTPGEDDFLFAESETEVPSFIKKLAN